MIGRPRMSSLSGKQGPRYRHIIDEGEPYETIGVEKLTPIIGAEVSGVDIGRLVSDDKRSNRQMDEIHRALAENLVIFFRDQHISPEQHLAFGRKFGELHIHPAAPHEGGDPALMKIYADKDSPRANGEGWHTDVSCDLEPPMGSILYIKQCPPRGGDTLFANMYAAYEALSDRMKTYLNGLTALHDGESIYRGLYANYGVADKPAYPRAVQDCQGPIADRTREHLGPTDLGILHFRKTVMDAARALQQGEAPPHLKHQDRYTVRSGACVANKAKDLSAVMIERFGDVAGFVGRPGIAAAE